MADERLTISEDGFVFELELNSVFLDFWEDGTVSIDYPKAKNGPVVIDRETFDKLIAQRNKLLDSAS